MAGNLAQLHVTHIAWPLRHAWHHELHSAAHIYLRAACLLRRSCTKKRALNYVENVNKDQNCDRLNFIFVHFSLENEDEYCIWHCIKMFCKTYSHCKLRNNGIGANNSIKWRKMSLFLGHFFTFQFGGFWQFFKPNNPKSGHGKSKLLLLSCREYLVLGTGFFVFLFFHLILNFSNY